ncbi:MAG: DUF2625 domain-containing protein [Propionibacteriaceae bacterium]|nr:DUF2625 domain-containing protein [Propionibacteriaceae bacterium]
MTRTLDELIQVDDPAWTQIEQWVTASPNVVQILPCLPSEGENTLYRLQVTAHSMLGGVALNCGAMTIDSGWVKVLGAGVPGLPGVAQVNGFPQQPGEAPPAMAGMIVAIDAIGGQFAIDGGGIGDNPGEVCYWDPSALAWVGLGAGHSEFVGWLLCEDHTDFYQDLRWDGWDSVVDSLDIGEGINVWPPPWSKEYKQESASRKAVPLREILDLNLSLAEQFGSELPLPWNQ